MRSPSRPLSALNLRVPPLALLAVSAALTWLMPRILPISFTGSRVTAALLAMSGGFFCVAGLLAFQRAQTTVNPCTPAASTSLVVSGVYRMTRNPMYLGFALLLLAFALWLGTLSGLLLVPLFMAYLDHFQIRPEEEALQARFGAAFSTYRQQVRRWL
ncbi:MAG: isoprenylcysteine carboxylmethyltransferase family protein [Comamonas sp.]|nr:isoprenylcysteine carboxylmethyltransferase family protein [Comamonas sp.]